MRHSRRNVLRGLAGGTLSCWMPSNAKTLEARPEQPAGADVVPRAGHSGPPMLLGTSVMDARQNQLVKSIGFSHLQTDSNHLIVNQPEPGRWDWTDADKGLASVREAGLKW